MGLAESQREAGSRSARSWYLLDAGKIALPRATVILDCALEGAGSVKGTRYFRLATGSLLLAAALSASSSLLSPTASLSAKKKIDRINSGSLRNGETVILSENEINSFFKYDHSGEMPEGVREVKVDLGEGGAVVRVFVDLSRAQDQQGAPGGIVWRFLLRGERKVVAHCRYRSADGYGRLDVDSVEIDGRTVPRFIVDWLIASYVNPQIPDFEVGKTVGLPKKVQEIRVQPARVVVVAY